MNPGEVIELSKTKMNQAVEHFQGELKKLRTGRATVGMLDSVKVTAYGIEMPLNQVASVSTPEPQLLQITPFDPVNIAAISSAIRNDQSLGMNPADDGRVVRIPVPSLTEERRQEIVKLASAKYEECLITLRNIRREANESIAKAKKDKLFGEDDAKRYSTRIDDTLKAASSRAEESFRLREAEIMEI